MGFNEQARQLDEQIKAQHGPEASFAWRTLWYDALRFFNPDTIEQWSLADTFQRTWRAAARAGEPMYTLAVKEGDPLQFHILGVQRELDGTNRLILGPLPADAKEQRVKPGPKEQPRIAPKEGSKRYREWQQRYKVVQPLIGRYSYDKMLKTLARRADGLACSESTLRKTIKAGDAGELG